ncbi:MULTISPECIES: hypothetical protein [Clostridium]|uniref:Uncharacterized protein n=1 Tax=Clostridium tagluense TaxID=360422 RepID=A0A401URP4_9CLOT|nr:MULTISPECIES: hypothetical protein [Clostridium]MBZ9635625.1 hypothetical protein [Clostridium sp. FP1]GCD12219.1 hypothetical protein Ctaglu_38420 [Clostridium tagluense]
MPATVTIVRPNNTPEEEIKVLERISHVIEKIITKEYGVKVKFTLKRLSS